MVYLFSFHLSPYVPPYVSVDFVYFRSNLPVLVNADMEDLLGKIMNQNFVPVLDEQKNFIGIITRRDIIGYCYDKLKEYGTQDDH